MVDSAAAISIAARRVWRNLLRPLAVKGTDQSTTGEAIMITQPHRLVASLSSRTRLATGMAVGLCSVMLMQTQAPQAAASTATGHVKRVALITVPHGSPPVFAVFSTDAPLQKMLNEEHVRAYPGGVGIEGPAAMEIFRLASSKHRWCYEAPASSTVRKRLRVGHTYRVQIALSNNRQAPRVIRHVALHRETEAQAARALGC